MPDMSVPPRRAGTTTMRTQPSEPTYILAANEAEHARLIALARGAADAVREMCARAGVGAGARVADVGCGPIGALVELAAIVGPQGAVVGIDSSAGAVETARAIVTRQQLGNVAVVHGDINTMDLTAVTAGRPFDAAHLRLVLWHQPDPAGMLRRVAALLRPGGTVLVADLLAHPRYDPPVPASERAWELLHAAAAARGVAQHVAYRLPRLCEEAGLRVLDARGTFDMRGPARDALAQTRGLIQSAGPTVVGTGLATATEIDRLVAELAAAEAQEFTSFINYLIVQVIAAVPGGA